MRSDTIFALATPAGRSALAVIRLSGRAAGPALDALAGRRPEPRRATRLRLCDPASGEALDDAVALWLPGPGSYTGEDQAELYCHGGLAVVRGVLDALGAMAGLRPAEPGEFTRRAFEAGKLDLTESEAVLDLIEAETAAQRRQALRQAGGALHRLYQDWAARLTRALALVEAGIDFAEEDLPVESTALDREGLSALAAEMAAHLDDGRRGERLREGLRVVLAGAPNVGKSSLLNALARREAAIVSEWAGTTRDVIEVHRDLGGYPVVLTDTAGLRATVDPVEGEGVRRAQAALAGADIVVAVGDAAAGVAPPAPEGLDGVAVLRVWNKIDRPGADWRAEQGALAVSAVTGAGLAQLEARLEEAVVEAAGLSEAPVVTRARHRSAVSAALAGLERALNGAEAALIAEDLRGAVHELGRVTGRVDVEDLLDVIFAEFCIGK